YGYGIDVALGGSVTAPGSASLTLTGTVATADTPAIILGGVLASGGGLSVGSGDLTLNGDVIDFRPGFYAGGSGSSTANGRLFFQPTTASRPLVLGGSDTPGSLVFSNADLAALSGFRLIILGSASGSGAVTTANNVTFGTNVTVQTPNNTTGGI